MFYCHICHYKAISKFNLERHLGTKKHLMKSVGTDEITECEYCHRKFHRYFNLKRHYEICKCKKKEEEVIIEKMKQKDEMIDVLKNELSFNKKVSTGIIMTQACKFIESNYPDASILEPMTGDEITINDDDDIESAKKFIELHEQGMLVDYVGNFICKKYKKKERERPIWSTDVSRMNYIIHEFLGWNPDKFGIKVRELIIRPILCRIHILMMEFIKIRTNRILSGHEEEATKYMNALQIANDISMKIESKTLEKTIIKNITPEFQIVKKKTEKLSF